MSFHLVYIHSWQEERCPLNHTKLRERVTVFFRAVSYDLVDSFSLSLVKENPVYGLRLPFERLCYINFWLTVGIEKIHPYSN